MKQRRLQLAFVSPINPVNSGISDYSESLLPALGELADVTLYSDCGYPANAALARVFWPRPVARLLDEADQFDLALYQIGNSDHHRQALDNLRRRPAVVTLHEPFLHHGLRAISRLRYRRELEYALGHIGEAELLSWQSESDYLKLMQVSTIRRLLDTSLGLIVHSHTARHMIEAERQLAGLPQAKFNVRVVPQLMSVLPMGAPALYRAEFNLPLDQLLIGIAGAVASIKEPALVLQAFAQLLQAGVSARLVFAGEQSPDDGLSRIIEDLGIGAHVTFLGRLDPLARLHRVMAACDILINLRRHTIGETSSTALRTLAMGRPLVVRALGWYDELPDEVCVKIEPEAEAGELAQSLIALAAAPAERDRLGAAGQSYIQRECNAPAVAAQYVDFLHEVYLRIGQESLPIP